MVVACENLLLGTAEVFSTYLGCVFLSQPHGVGLLNTAAGNLSVSSVAGPCWGLVNASADAIKLDSSHYFRVRGLLGQQNVVRSALNQVKKIAYVESNMSDQGQDGIQYGMACSLMEEVACTCIATEKQRAIN